MSAVADRERAVERAVEFLGLSEAAEALGVSRQRVHQLVNEGRSPAPVGTLRGTPLWTASAVRRWAAKRASSTRRRAGEHGNYLDTAGGRTLASRFLYRGQLADESRGVHSWSVAVEVVGKDRCHVVTEHAWLVGRDRQPGLEPGVRHVVDFRRWVPPSDVQLVRAVDEAIQAGRLVEVA